jgi:2-dehydro-3-deoxyphosphogluconate aldolase / (4S)-4-hydroxy-2-oxoglutarate aldolase
LATPLNFLAGARVVPLIQADDPATAVRIARALVDGGLRVLEVVQRTARSAESLAAICAELPGAVTGAGTVLTGAQAKRCIAAGAKFIVSPGLDDGVVAAARDCDVDVLPGIMTPTELQHAHNLGLSTVKFFPAATAGGVPALRALASAFPSMRFVPTGGITASNLSEYLAVPSVLACGGTWMTPPPAIAGRRFEEITSLASAALALATTQQEPANP